MPGIKPGAAGCKARALSIVLCSPLLDSLLISNSTKSFGPTVGTINSRVIFNEWIFLTKFLTLKGEIQSWLVAFGGLHYYCA